MTVSSHSSRVISNWSFNITQTACNEDVSHYARRALHRHNLYFLYTHGRASVKAQSTAVKMAIWTGRRRKSSMFKSAICGTYICIVIVYASVLILYGFIDQIVKFSDGGEYVVARKRLVQETTVGTQEMLNVTGK